jgi:hypothetical protein
MKVRLAAVDANVVMFLVQPRPEDEPRYKRWSQVHATVRKLLEQGAELVIPTPSLAEMYATRVAKTASAWPWSSKSLVQF